MSNANTKVEITVTVDGESKTFSGQSAGDIHSSQLARGVLDGAHKEAQVWLSDRYWADRDAETRARLRTRNGR